MEVWKKLIELESESVIFMQEWKNPISISPLQLNYSAMTIQRMSGPMPDDLAQVENT